MNATKIIFNSGDRFRVISVDNQTDSSMTEHVVLQLVTPFPVSKGMPGIDSLVLCE